VERGVVLSRGDYLEETELSLWAAPGAIPAPSGSPVVGDVHAVGVAASTTIAGGLPDTATLAAPTGEAVAGGKRPLSLDEMEQETIIRTLAEVQGNKSEAARRLGITRRTLHLKLKKYGLMT